MIILITGASHTGKTMLAQKLLEKYHFPTLSEDHLKMGLIRSGRTVLTPESSDEEITALLWPIEREIIKTAIENGQNLIVEGCYLPFDYAKDFDDSYRKQIRFVCLIFSERYIRAHGDLIQSKASVIEKRMCDEPFDREEYIGENERNLALCRRYGCDYRISDENYSFDFDIS